MSLIIRGLATALPCHSISQEQAAAAVSTFFCQTDEQAQRLPALFGRAGINSRYSVLLNGPPGELNWQTFYPPSTGPHDRGPKTSRRMEAYRHEAPALAFRAASRALEESSVTAKEIDHLITVSCTGFFAPGIDIQLIKRLRLFPTVQRTHVGFMGCHGALNGLQIASALTAADPKARVLMCAVELCTLHLHYGWNAQSVVPHALFADGAAALVATSTSPPAPPRFGKGEGQGWTLAATGSCLFPDSEHGMTWNIGDHGFEMTLSADVPDLLLGHLRPWMDRWLNDNQLTVAKIGSWAVHPGGPRILSAVGACLGIKSSALDVSTEVLSECGNMSSPTILFILHRLREQDAARPCVVVAFGPGLVAEAALFR
jgi:predicted naringenin-chalcone synthase